MTLLNQNRGIEIDVTVGSKKKKKRNENENENEKKEIGKNGRKRGEKKEGRNIKWLGGKVSRLCAILWSVVRVYCVTGNRWERTRKNRSLGKVEEDRGRETRSRKGEREKKNWTRGISLARYRCHGQFLSSYLLEGGGGPRLKIVTRTVPGKCVSRESESGGRARVELELMIHTDGTSFKIVRPSYVVPVVVFLVRGKLLVVLETENAENLCRKWDYYFILKRSILDRTFVSCNWGCCIN